MEPQIRYVTNSRGASIAYFAIGSGPPMIATSPNIGTTIAREWEMPAFRRIGELTSRAFTYIRYDPHGCGSSDRSVEDLSVESYAEDLEAVADDAAPDPFVLFANGAMTAPALVYAARHPDRLTHLILWMASAFPGDYTSPLDDQIMSMASTDWRMACESLVRAVDNWEHEELTAPLAAMMRESVSPETYVKFETERRTWDVHEYLPRIATPTLIIHPRNHPYFGQEPAKRVAAAIPGARLALVESATVLFPDEKVAAVAGEFLGASVARRAPERTRASGTANILFADIVDSTALTERLGDAMFRTRARELDDALRRIIGEHAGTAIEGKLLGDGVLATFSAARDAIAAAVAFGTAAKAAGLELHLGIHAGDVIREDRNVYGGAVNIAARICALSAPGEILVSDVVRGMARSSAGVAFEDRGEQTMKGVGEPVRVYAVRWQE